MKDKGLVKITQNVFNVIHTLELRTITENVLQIHVSQIIKLFS